LPAPLRISTIPPLLALAISLISGCGEVVQPPPPVKQEVLKLTPEQEFAAALKKAEAGDAQAQADVGAMYATGYGTPLDYANTLLWCEKGAAQGNAKAQRCLGIINIEGKVVRKDAVKAMELWQKAAEQGDATAKFAIGTLLSDGDDGVPKDIAKAIEWYQKAAAQNSTDALESLARIYAHGNGVPKEVGNAVSYYEKAAALGSSNAQYMLGTMYENGNGVAEDKTKAMQLFEKAAMQGNLFGQTNVARCYQLGIGVPKNYERAVEWLQKSAAQDWADSQYYLGYAYLRGVGTAMDKVLAYAWFNISSSRPSLEDTTADAKLTSSQIEAALTSEELAEAQRLSSNWKKGSILVREGGNTKAGTSPSSGNLSKKSTGTIFIVSKTGHAITNQHVAGGCTEIRIQGRDGVAKLITEDANNDLALVQIQGNASDTAIIASEPSKVRQGEDIVAFGFPLNSVLSSGGNLTPGIVSAMTGFGNNTNQIQITAPIQPGSSGSPVLNKKGEVVGVVSTKLSDTKMANATGQIGQNVNFAVSGLTLKTFLDTHKVPYSSGGFFSREKSTVDLADEARKWTLVVECWK
jgi:TPR repeat protein